MSIRTTAELEKEAYCCMEFNNGTQHVCYEFSTDELAEYKKAVALECANKCLDMKYVNPGPHHYAVMLKEHFGVE